MVYYTYEMNQAGSGKEGFFVIIQTVDKHDFVKVFDDWNHSDNFSVAGRETLFDYLDELSEDCGTPLELDPIAICCDFGEYTKEELIQDYGEDDEDIEALLERLNYETLILEVGTEPERWIVQAF
ncbi:hypothetical protein FACS1894204_11810 [Synergistales bacterium]|nr:hypothetical protein FACS1894204_11810 [Synergistales bacterium]